MAQLACFNSVEHLLMHPSPEADAQLSQAVLGVRYRCGIQAAAAIERSRDSLRYVPFRRGYEPPAGAAGLAYPFEEGEADTVRCRYTVERLIIEVAQSRHLISVRMIDPELAPNDTPCTTICEQSARFLELEGFVPVEAGGEAGLAYGKNRPIQPSPWGAPDWFYHLKWWIAPQECGLVSLKASGPPTR